MADGTAAERQRHPLAAVRAVRGWSYRDLAEAVAVQSRSLGVPMAARREKVWRWEHWGVVPDSDTQRALALALGVAVGRLAGRPWPSWLPTGAELPRDLPWDRHGALAALRALLADVEDDRRGFPIAGRAVLADAWRAWSVPAGERGFSSGAGGFEAAELEFAAGWCGVVFVPTVAGAGRDVASDPCCTVVGPASANGSAWANGSTSAECGSGDIADAWLRLDPAVVRSLIRLVRTADPAIVRRRINADLGLIADQLCGRAATATAATTAATTAAAEARLHRAAATLAYVGARHSLRIGLHGPAQRYFLSALRCAYTAEDLRLGAAVLTAFGRHSTRVGETWAAARFLDLAARLRR